ncbi:hypothetical protein M0R88_06770 [Halorussus gelatinilyticus]|uniref:Origin-associated protein OapC n=1 Tax=Halorussus gelatinilyticus TaxID=2937524 RepID=A0A8U0IKX2_9EURY|nr:Zn-ribbon containing protein [Halorussus gelatinilyticus]UPW01797.1 hypothetical protein M0R88_06770 [Halorussus gelatinilyticus]
MPHQCTNCGRTFEDGSKEMLSGCPDCGGNKFQFKPASAADGNAGGGVGAGTASPATEPKKTPENARSARDAPETGGRSGANGNRGATESMRRDDSADGGAASGAVNRAAATVRDWVSTRDDTETASAPEGGSATKRDRGGSTRNTPAPDAPSAEDSAQASARSDVVSDSELPEPPDDAAQVGPAPADADDENVVGAPDDENPGLKELREELNSQFESIRIVNPGQYELNLMELYEREEYIISLQEDGKYVIEVPDAWDATER